MERTPHPALKDILDQLAGIERSIAGKTFADFQSDWLLQRGLERAIEIISEASRRIPAHLQALRPEIPWREVATIGNILRHEYESVSKPIIWNVIQKDLPALRAAVEAIQRAAAHRKGS